MNIRTRTRRSRWGMLLVMGLVSSGLLAGDVAAQRIPFGAADDPREQLQDVWWRRESHLYAAGGLSLIAAQWRGAGSLTLDLVTRSLTARLSGTVRAGVLGKYTPDINEPYDLVRLVEFARYNPPRAMPLHLRAGLIDRMRLGVGHVVNFFSSSTAWDERTVGTEMVWYGDRLEVGAFTDNVLLNGITGGRIAVRPRPGSPQLYVQTFKLGFNYVRDFASIPAEFSPFAAYNIDAQFDLFSSGDIHFAPYLSYAWYRRAGDGLAFGADLYSDEFIDLLSFRLRLGLFYNSERFIPGYVGAFYPINNAHARILDSGSDLRNPEMLALAYTALDEARGGNDVLTELQFLVPRRFEFWYYFRRHNGTQRLSELHLRLFIRAIDRMRLEVGIDRGRLGSFFTVFNDMDDVSSLVFGLDYRAVGPLWLFLNARYSYERVHAGGDDQRYYLIQRRFEPLAGLRYSF